jgi:hypothetical protein
MRESAAQARRRRMDPKCVWAPALAALRARIRQLTAFLTRAPILASSAAVNSVSANATGHI